MARGAAAPIGKERVSQNGYHYTKTADGWVLTHRLIMERDILKRPLAPGERVIFKDRNRLNLDPDNLTLDKVKTGIASLHKRRIDLTVRIEELQGQLADVEEEIRLHEALGVS